MREKVSRVTYLYIYIWKTSRSIYFSLPFIIASIVARRCSPPAVIRHCCFSQRRYQGFPSSVVDQGFVVVSFISYNRGKTHTSNNGWCPSTQCLNNATPRMWQYCGWERYNLYSNWWHALHISASSTAFLLLFIGLVHGHCCRWCVCNRGVLHNVPAT